MTESNLSGIRECMKLLASCEGVKPRWIGERKDLTCKVIASLSIRNFENVGMDEIRQTYNATKDQLDIEVHGQRYFTLQVQYETNTTADADSSWRAAERFRSKLKNPSTKDVLAGFCISLLSVGTVATVEIGTGDRFFSRSTIEAKFLVKDVREDCPIPYIETVTVRTQNFKNPDGSDVANSIDEHEKEISLP